MYLLFCGGFEKSRFGEKGWGRGVLVLGSLLPDLGLPVAGVGLGVGPLLSPAALEFHLSALDLQHLPTWVMPV